MSAINTNKAYEGIVVDDGSTDKSIEIVKEKFPEIKIVKNIRNLGFAETVNKGVSESSAKIVVLLNNDIVVPDNFFTEILKPFDDNFDFEKINPGSSDKNIIFGVSAKTVNWDSGDPNHLNMTAQFKSGEISLDYEDSREIKKTFFVQGGAGAFIREKFLELGGFNKIFHPGYWEDYDLSYIAMKYGYINLYQPFAVAQHYGKGTMLALLGNEGLHLTVRRNHYLFTWINITDKTMLFRHFMTIPWLIAKSAFKNQTLFELKAFLKAAQKLPQVLKIRNNRFSKRKFVKTDNEILNN